MEEVKKKKKKKRARHIRGLRQRWIVNSVAPVFTMIECAIRSLELVLPQEKGKDAW